MRADLIRLLVTATAVSVIPDNVAFDMLQETFIDNFQEYYNERVRAALAEGKDGKLIYLDELINYTLISKSTEAANIKSLSSLNSPEVKYEIKQRFVSMDLADMLSMLAMRPPIKSSVRQQLHRNDKHGVHHLIDSTRFDKVFSDFIDMFRQSSAANYMFTGTFERFVLHCFSYFYRNKSRDIWRILNAPDDAKREAETNLGGVKIIEAKRTDDMPIRDLILNIIVLNKKVFTHAAQSPEACKVIYDSYYLIMNHLCRERVAKLNEELKDYRVVVIDELDRRATRYGLAANKSMASKITNEWDLLPILFNGLRSNDWTLDSLTELREVAFKRGKRDRDGINCPWVDITSRGATAHYLDSQSAPPNYVTFDIMMKGILSIITLMRGLEERGYSIIETYPLIHRVLFDEDLARYVDYLSALWELDTIKEAQLIAASFPERKNGLLQFGEMVHDYAGSAQNNDPKIVANHREAKLRGLLSNKKRKQVGNFRTPYECLNGVAGVLTSIPRAYDEYVMKLAERNILNLCWGTPAVIDTAYCAPFMYRNGGFNTYFVTHPELANYYLQDVVTDKMSLGTLEWSFGGSLVPQILYRESYRTKNWDEWNHVEFNCLYVPVIGQFLICPKGGDTAEYSAVTLEQLQMMVRGSLVDGVYTRGIRSDYLPLPIEIFSEFVGTKVTPDNIKEAMEMSIGFTTNLGFANLRDNSFRKKIDGLSMPEKYRNYINRYFDWLADLSAIQGSFIDILYSMFTFCLYVLKVPNSIYTDVDKEMARTLMDGLMTQEFTESSISWFFSHFIDSYNQNRGIMLKVNEPWGKSRKIRQNPGMTQANLYCINHIFSPKNFNCEVNSAEEAIISSLKDYSNPAQRFVLLFNFLSGAINFLRILRESYELCFGYMKADVDSFFIELDSSFDITKTLANAKGVSGIGSLLDIRYAAIDTISSEFIFAFAQDVKRRCWVSFSVLGEDLIAYLSGCQTNISKFVDYEIKNSQVLKSDFKEYGSMFHVAGPYVDSFVSYLIGDLRVMSKTDEAGFMLLRNTYLRGTKENSEYYIHVTGRVLEVKKGNMHPMTFDFTKEEDRSLYKEIISSGKANCRW